MTEGRRLVNVEEAAEYLGLHPESVRRMARRGDIRGRKIGRRGGEGEWRFRPEDLDAAFDQETKEVNDS